MRDLINKRFGKLLVLSKTKGFKFKGTHWFCLCDCTEVKTVRESALVNGSSRSCGCSKRFRKMRVDPDRQAFDHVYCRYRAFALKRELSFGLSKEQFAVLTKSNCYYCGAEPSQINKRRNGSYVYNGVDRLKNEIGYRLENCVASCGPHNHMKGVKTPEEFIASCRSVVEYQDQKVCKALVA